MKGFSICVAVSCVCIEALLGKVFGNQQSFLCFTIRAPVMMVVYLQTLSAHSMGSAMSVYSAVFNIYKQQDLFTLAGNM